MPLFKTLLGIENLHYSIFKEPPGTGCDFHTTPARSILDDRTAVKVKKLSEFLRRNRTAKNVLHIRTCHFCGFSRRFLSHSCNGCGLFFSLLFVATLGVFKKIFHQSFFESPDLLHGNPDAVTQADGLDLPLIDQAVNRPVANGEISGNLIHPVILFQELC